MTPIGLCLGIGFVLLAFYLCYAFGASAESSTCDEDRDADYFDQPLIWSRDQKLSCLSCDYVHIFAPDRDSPLYCPRCGLPLVSDEE
jgi:hypothetical protein